MSEEKDKETIETKEEEETSETSEEEETSGSEQETEEKKPEVADEKKVTQKELDKVYARMKLAEEKAKKAEAKLAEKPETTSEPDVDAIVEINIATKDLSPEEIAELRFRAAANKTTLSEARKDENFIIWQGAYKEKVDKNQTLSPSTKQAPVAKRKSLGDMTIEEKEEALIKMGSNKATWTRQRDAKK